MCPIAKSLFTRKTHTLRILLLNISLSATLLRLSNIMLLLSLNLRLPITRQASDGSTDSAPNPVRDTTAEVVELALSLLGLALSILFAACLLQVLLLPISFVHHQNI